MIASLSLRKTKQNHNAKIEVKGNNREFVLKLCKH